MYWDFKDFASEGSLEEKIRGYAQSSYAYDSAYDTEKEIQALIDSTLDGLNTYLKEHLGMTRKELMGLYDVFEEISDVGDIIQDGELNTDNLEEFFDTVKDMSAQELTDLYGEEVATQIQNLIKFHDKYADVLEETNDRMEEVLRSTKASIQRAIQGELTPEQQFQAIGYSIQDMPVLQEIFEDGKVSAEEMWTAYDVLGERMDEGNLSAEDFSSIMDIIIGQFEQAADATKDWSQTIAQSQMQLNDVLGKKFDPELFLQSIGMKGDATGALPGIANQFLDAFSDEKISEKELTNTFEGLNTALKEGKISGEEYSAMFSQLTSKYQQGQQALEQFNQQVEGLNVETLGMSEFEKQLHNVQETFNDLIDKAMEVGATEEQLADIRKWAKYQIEELIESEKDRLEALRQQRREFVWNMESAIASLRGVEAEAEFSATKMAETKDVFLDQQDMQSLDAYTQSVGQWVQAQIASINADYQQQISEVEEARNKYIESQREAIDSQTEALQEQKEAAQEQYQAQIEAAQEQLKIAQQWLNVLESTQQALKDMMITSANPLDRYARLDIARQDVQGMLSEYQGAAGMERAEIGGDIVEAAQQYLRVAQESGMQRSSPQYQMIWDQVKDWLEMVEGDAQGRDIETYEDRIESLQESQKAELESIDEQIKTLRETEIDLSQYDARIETLQEEQKAEVQAIKDQAIGYYQWAREQGQKILDEQMVTVEERIAQANSTLNEMLAVGSMGHEIGNQLMNEMTMYQSEANQLLSRMLAEMQAEADHTGAGTLGSYATGTDYVPHTGLYQLHQGEAVIPAGENRGGNFTLKFDNGAIQVNVSASGEVDESKLGQAIADGMIYNIKYNHKARKELKEAVS
jgi:DNA-binding ferritin-like protein (Dps family)